MNIEHLEEFIDLANTLNFTKSSANLHITQPTLSKHIAELERQIGSPLFIRTTNSVKLTQAGKLLYEKACALVADYSSIIEDVQIATQTPMETLRVGGSTVQPTVNRILSMLSMRASMEKLPIRFEYYKTRALSNDRPAPYSVDALRNGEIDFAIDTCAFNDQPPRGLDCIMICDEPITLIASARNPLAHAVDLKIEDLFASTLVVFAVQQHCPKVLLAPFLAAGYSPRRTKTVFVDNMLEIPEHIANLADDEIIPMQRFYCQAFGFDQDGVGNITALNVNDSRLRASFWALFRKNDDKAGVRAAAALLEDMVDACKANAPEQVWSTDRTLWSSAFYIA